MESSKEDDLSSTEIRQRNDAKKEGEGIKGRVYSWVIDRYSKNGNLFTFSDQFIWKGTIFIVPTWIGYLIFISLFLLLAHAGIEKYGEARTYIFFMLLIMWRVQSVSSELRKLNDKL